MWCQCMGTVVSAGQFGQWNSRKGVAKTCQHVDNDAMRVLWFGVCCGDRLEASGSCRVNASLFFVESDELCLCVEFKGSYAASR